MDFPREYDGNIHPDKWIENIQRYFDLWHGRTNFLNLAISLVDSTIKLPTEIKTS